MYKQIKYKKMTKKSGRNFCDELWSILVKTRDGYKCMVCGEESKPNSHHLISRKVFKYRWDTSNGVTLCPNHHEFDVSFSAHTAPWALEEWMQENRPYQYAKHVEARRNISNEEINYPDIYAALEEEYKELTGEYFKIGRLSQYRMFKNAEVINEMYNVDGQSIEDIAVKFGFSKPALTKFMLANRIKVIPPKKSK